MIYLPHQTLEEDYVDLHNLEPSCQVLLMHLLVYLVQHPYIKEKSGEYSFEL